MKTIFLMLSLCLNLMTLHVSAQSLEFAIMGDAGRWNSNTRLLEKSIKSQDVYNLIMPGDNVYTGTYADAWNPWIQNKYQFAVTAIGNHHNGYANEVSFFNMPAEYYSKKYLDGSIEYIVLNSDNKATSAAQLAWLKTTIVNSKAQQIFLVYHHPSLTVGDHKWTEKKDFQIGLRQILKTYRSRLTAVMVGHDHIASLMHFDSLPVIISGSTQSPDKSQPINNVQENIKVTTQIHFSGAPYWIKQTVYPDHSEFTFIRASDSRELCKATIETGQTAKYNCF